MLTGYFLFLVAERLPLRLSEWTVATKLTVYADPSWRSGTDVAQEHEGQCIIHLWTQLQKTSSEMVSLKSLTSLYNRMSITSWVMGILAVA